MQRYALIFLATIRNCGDAYGDTKQRIMAFSNGDCFPIVFPYKKIKELRFERNSLTSNVAGVGHDPTTSGL